MNHQMVEMIVLERKQTKKIVISEVAQPLSVGMVLDVMFNAKHLGKKQISENRFQFIKSDIRKYLRRIRD